MDSPLNPTTNFKDNNGTDLGDKLVTKDYLISVYPGLASQLGITPELWVWGNSDSGQLGNAATTNRSTPVTTLVGGPNWKQISSGYRHIAAIKNDGTLWTWGNGIFGQLGTNDTINRSTPVTTFTGTSNWIQVSSGRDYTAAVKTDGTLWTWGEGIYGKLGLGSPTNVNRSTPVTTFAGGTNWADTATTEPENFYTLSAGSKISAAIKTDGTLWTWGYGIYGSLGNATTSFSTISTPITTFAGGTNWKQVSVGKFKHGAGIKTDGTLWTWGYNRDGTLGNASTTNVSTPVTTFAGGTNWKQVSSGGYYIAAIKTDGTLWTWGYGGVGNLGINASTNRSTPVTTFSGGTNWNQVSCGYRHTAAIKTDGSLWIWGKGDDKGQLGTGVYERQSTPVTTFAGGTNWKQVNCGYQDTVAAIKTDGTLWMWGDGQSGGLGNAALPGVLGVSTPVTTFAGGTNWKQVSTGGRFVTSAIKTDGTLWVWGRGNQLGINSTTIRSTPVTTFIGGTNWDKVSSGTNSILAVKTDGILWTWGGNTYGQLGTNDLINKSTPVTTFAGGTNWSSVEPEELYTLSAGINHNAAIKTDGTLWTWGNTTNYLGVIATGYSLTRQGIFTPVTTFAGGTNWKQITTLNAGSFGSVAAIKTDGTLWAWGEGKEGQLGNKKRKNRSTPVTTFAGGTNWKQISGGDRHIAAVKTDGTLWTWGNGLYGQLGNGNTISRVTPITTFAGGTDWKQVSAGYYFTSAIKTDGTLWTWGQVNSGRLGNGVTTGKISTPVTTFAGGTNWKQVSSGGRHAAAIKTDGTLWIWGNSILGRLGTNDVTPNRSTPVTTFAGGTDWKQVSCAGYQYTAAVKTDGTLWTWGEGDQGVLGINDITWLERSTPVTTFAGGTNWRQVDCGWNGTIIALKSDGTLWTWGGRSEYGILGNNGDSTQRITPITTFAGGTNWADAATTNSEDLYTISCGYYHAGAIKTDGTLWTWGRTSSGEIGDATFFKNYYDPLQVHGWTTTWKQVSSGDLHTAAIKTDGTLWTWGNGALGRLGTNDTINRHTPITTFAGGTDWKQVSCGDAFTAAIKTDGTLWTWGSGILGNFSTTNVFTPITTFAGGTDWKQVSSGYFHTAAIKTDGTLWTWGSGSNGRLGNRLTTNVSTPITTFAGGTDWKQVNARNQHTAAVKTDGTLWTWGNGNAGRLGNAVTTTLNKSTPITTFAGGTDWKQVSCGDTFTAAIKTDGTLWTWGNGRFGSLGNGLTDVTTRISTPITTFAGGTDWKQVSAGYKYIIALNDDGVNKRLYVWGNNSSQSSVLGIGNFIVENASIPSTTFAGGTNWKQVSAGGNHTLSVRTDGTLWAWGSGVYGQLGNGVIITDRSTPVTTRFGGTNWKLVSAGEQFSTSIKTDGTLWTWGNGFYGQLGNAATTNRSTPITTQVGGTNWKSVSAGSEFVTAIKNDGTLWTWGSESNGQLGRELLDLSYKSTPVTTFAGGTNWADTPTTNPEDLYTISSSPYHVGAIKTDGTLYLWGGSRYGKLGNATTTIDIFTPITTFAGGNNWKQISCTDQHTAAIKTDGTLWTWGYGLYGALGNADIFNNKSTPVTTFAGGTDWKQVSAGYYITAAIKTDGTLWTWGYCGKGQLGNGYKVFLNISTPVTTFAGGTNWKQVSCSISHTSAIKTDGTLWTWGDSYRGGLGNITQYNSYTPITTFAGGTNWADTPTTNPEDLYTISAGYHASAAIKTDGTLWVWGSTQEGRLGNGITTSFIGGVSTPITTFAGGTNWKQVSVGPYNAAAAIKTDGTLWVWGNGIFRQLGTNDLINRSTPVTTFAGGTDWKQVSTGSNLSTSAIKTDGTLWVWGAGNIRLGNFSSTSVFTPITTFAGGTDWKQVSTGSPSTAAIKTDGTLWTWGYGLDGVLGNADITNRSTPVTTFAGGTDWKQVSCGDTFTAAIKTDGTLWTWGNGRFGILGNGIITGIVSTPITTFAGGINWKQVSTEDRHIAAIKTDGTLWTWGNGIYGRLGTNDQINRSTPVTTFVGGTNWKQVECGAAHTIALNDDGVNKRLFVWGDNYRGELGNGSIKTIFEFTDVFISTPITTFAGGTNWKQVSAGDAYTSAIKTDGTLWTWGSNNRGQCGIPNDIFNVVISTPVTTFAGGTDWKQVSFSPGWKGEGRCSAAIKTDGTLWIWGDGFEGALGNADTTDRSTPVTTFAGGTNWRQVTTGNDSMMALKSDGTLWTWGDGRFGKLGNIFANNSFSAPRPVGSVSTTSWKQVSGGTSHTIAIKTDGTLWTWGSNNNGQLGTNDMNSRSLPVTTFVGGSDWKRVSAGGFYTSATKSSDY